MDPIEAVENLNDPKHKLIGVSIKSLEALYDLNGNYAAIIEIQARFILAHKCAEITKSLNEVAWTQICLYGSVLCRFLISNKKEDRAKDETQLEQLVHRVKFTSIYLKCKTLYLDRTGR